MMTISKDEYIKLQPYWDFQRKKEYNKEQLMYVCEHIMGIEKDSFFEEMWVRLDEKNYLEPPQHWIPKDKKFRIEGE